VSLVLPETCRRLELLASFYDSLSRCYCTLVNFYYLCTDFFFFLQLAAELRIPVKGMHVYGFAEHGNDLGSSKDVKENPTEVYR